MTTERDHESVTFPVVLTVIGRVRCCHPRSDS